jgi:hypothetical protein
VKKQLSLLKTKIETIEERFAIGEIESDIFKKFNTKYKEDQKDVESNLLNSTISSSNLQMAIDKALKISSNLSYIWTSGDLTQKKKIQNLVFPSGIGYDKSKGRVRTTRVNSIFSCIPYIARELRETKNGEPVKKKPILRLGDPEGIRTPNRQSRNLIFYPVELRSHFGKYIIFRVFPLYISFIFTL